MTVDASAAARSRLRSASAWGRTTRRSRRITVDAATTSPASTAALNPISRSVPASPSSVSRPPASVTPSASRAAMRGPRTSSRANRPWRPTSCSPAASCATASTTRHSGERLDQVSDAELAVGEDIGDRRGERHQEEQRRQTGDERVGDALPHLLGEDRSVAPVRRG